MLCTALRPLAIISLAISVLPITLRAEPSTIYRYRDNHFGIEHAYEASDHEILVRFDGTWTDADVAALEAEWGLAPVRPLARELGLGVYRAVAGDALIRARRMASAVQATAGRSFRVHVGLVGDEGQDVRFVPGQIVIQFARDLPETEIRSILAGTGCEILEDFWTPGYYRVGLPAGRDLFSEIGRFNGMAEVEFACPAYVGFDEEAFVPDDPLYPDQWHLNNTLQLGGVLGADIDAERAWDATFGDSTVLIAIIDSGVDLFHQDVSLLERPVGHDWSFGFPDSTGFPQISAHGTHVAGVAVAQTNNGIGVAGIAPGCPVLPIRINLTQGFYANRADAINYVLSWQDDYPRIVYNCSWNTIVDDLGIRLACRNAFEAGCVVVFSSGNDGDDETEVKWPARYGTTFAVGATTMCDTRVKDGACGSIGWTFESNWGDSLDVVAPGVEILTLDITGALGDTPTDYDSFRGTSAAAPAVAGIAALVWSSDTSLTNVEVMDIIRQTAEDQVGDPDEDTPGFDPYYGWGRVNAFEAVKATGVYRGTITGPLWAATEVVTLPDDTLQVGSLLHHRYAIAPDPVDAQNVRHVHVTGTVTSAAIGAGEDIEVEFGLVSRAQRDRWIPADPENLFNQAVFMRYVRSDSGFVAQMGDHDCSFEGGCSAASEAVNPVLTFDLHLAPSDTTGGTASLLVNGAVVDTGFVYGTDNDNLFGGGYPDEDLSEAYLIVQVRSASGADGSVAFRNVRVETIFDEKVDPIPAHVAVLESSESADADTAGIYALEIARFEERTLVYSAAGYYPDTLGFYLAGADARYQPVGLRPIPMGLVEGTVTASGSPQDSVEVRVVGGPGIVARTDAAGAYFLGLMEIGVYNFRYIGGGYGPRWVRGYPVLPDSVHVIDLDILAGFDDDIEFGEGFWTHAPGDTASVDEWHVSGARNHTAGGDSAWKCGSTGAGGYDPANYSILRMPPVVPGPDEALMFYHFMRTAVDGAYARHGGRVEASVDSGRTWEIVFPQGGYPYRTPPDYTGPLGPDTPLFAGSINWPEVGMSLHHYAGDTLFVRFVFAADSVGVPSEGWYVDDLLIRTGGVVGLEELAAQASSARLYSNVPNPFNPRTTIAFEIGSGGPVRLSVFDISGRLVRQIVDGAVLPAGRHRAVWDGRDARGRPVSSGVYLSELEAAGARLSRRMILLR